ncbi:Hypothetical protein SRAE_X000101500 [Strongyloides ratti]|uniref:Uncharacterized protein n=1 Tax=Strongyloides ratti TaxID=34506 RepID=A0A090KPI0_STRRB|nr:Hypothetical protein SRAE_X000101500 [Strongyloides ratti]CEF59264.1 Hypothetical protein SRAE_X000101500 [Strongyloides ratti]
MSDDFITPKKSKTFKPSLEMTKNAVEYYQKIVDIDGVSVENKMSLIKQAKITNSTEKKNKVKKKKFETKKNNKTKENQEDDFEKGLQALAKYKDEQIVIELQKKSNINIPREIVSENEIKKDFTNLEYTPKQIQDFFKNVFYDIHEMFKQNIVN